MNLHALTINVEQPDEFDREHGTVILESNAWDDPTVDHAMPGPDEQLYQARILAAGILARVTLLALPALDVERREHTLTGNCRGDRLGGCYFSTWLLDTPTDNGCDPVNLSLTVPGDSLERWEQSVREWVATVIAADQHRPHDAQLEHEHEHHAPSTLSLVAGGRA